MHHMSERKILDSEVRARMEAHLKMAMSSERSEFYRGYIAGICDLWPHFFPDQPRLVLEARDWYKPKGSS